MALAAATAYAVSLVVAISPQAIHTGTGFAVKSDSHTTQFVTAAHVVAGASRVVVILQDGSSNTATVLARDRVRDAAVVSIDVGNRQTLTLSHQPPVADDAIVVIGYPGRHDLAVSGYDLSVVGGAQQIVADGKVAAVEQRGESIIFKADVGHGDSGAPIIDRATNAVVGVTTGTFLAAGDMLAYNGMDFGLSSAGLSALLHPALPVSGARPPQYVVAIAPAAAPAAQTAIAMFVHTTFVQNLAEQADFIAVDAPWAKDTSSICHAANAHAIASVSASSDGALVATGISVTDCIGNPFFAESQSLLADQPTVESEHTQAVLLSNQLEADFNGWADSQRGAWLSLLRYGIAVAPDDAHNYALFRLGSGALDANRVLAVMPGGPASIAGVRTGDVIMAIDGTSTQTMLPPDIRAALDRTSVALTVERAKRSLALTLRPRRYPELLRMLGYTQ
ncbi:MAG TPA: trypsin-like peptidase domain-containing protein [Candidatus Eremiobacteraceae bacterium]|jgi:S1-C subfamily serine protease